MAARFQRTRAASWTICARSTTELLGLIDVETHSLGSRLRTPLGRHSAQGHRQDRRSRGLVYKAGWRKIKERCGTVGRDPEGLEARDVENVDMRLFAYEGTR